jgi:hypothetical protein
MDRFDDALRGALRREDPGEEFTRRVLAAVAKQPVKAGWRERLAAAFRMPALRLATASALAVVLIAGGVEVRREARIRAEGQAAKQQLMLAMRIAGAKLHAAQSKVLEMSEQ